MNLDTMLSKPGIYSIADFHVIFFVEVLPGGECHQLKPDTFERDGVLKREGWNLRGDEQIFGPLSRPTDSADQWPIAKLTVREDSEQVSATLYAPGLPPGEFDVWLGAGGVNADAQRLDWLERNPRLAEIVIDGKVTPAVYYAVSGAPGLKLREIIDGIMKVEAGEVKS